MVVIVGVHLFSLTAPGSWTQFAANLVTPSGSVLGLDLTPVLTSWPPHVRTETADIFKWQPGPELHRHFDVLLSDMMANTSGISTIYLTIMNFIFSMFFSHSSETSGSKQLDADRSTDLCLRALELSATVLKPEGCIVLKVFQGKPFIPLMKSVRSKFGFCNSGISFSIDFSFFSVFQMNSSFQEVHSFKPKSCRSESKETFLIGRVQKKPFLLEEFEKFEDEELSKGKKL